jgi:hypothetical protein
VNACQERRAPHGCNDDADAGVEPESDEEQRRGRVEVEEDETRRGRVEVERRAPHGCNDDADAGVEPESDDEQRRGRVEVEEDETRRDETCLMPFFVLDEVCKVRTGAYEGGTACVRACDWEEGVSYIAQP